MVNNGLVKGVHYFLEKHVCLALLQNHTFRVDHNSFFTLYHKILNSVNQITLIPSKFFVLKMVLPLLYIQCIQDFRLDFGRIHNERDQSDLGPY